MGQCRRRYVDFFGGMCYEYPKMKVIEQFFCKRKYMLRFLEFKIFEKNDIYVAYLYLRQYQNIIMPLDYISRQYHQFVSCAFKLGPFVFGDGRLEITMMDILMIKRKNTYI